MSDEKQSLEAAGQPVSSAPEPCPCTECRAARLGFGGFSGYTTDEKRLENARKRYLDEPVRWGPQVYTAAWFEREVDEILRVTHHRFVTEQMRWDAAFNTATPSPPRSALKPCPLSHRRQTHERRRKHAPFTPTGGIVIYLVPIGIVSGLLLVLCARRLADIYASAAWMLGAMLTGIVVLGCVLVPIIVYSSRSVGHTTCRNWGEQVGVQTKFKILNWADTGTCLAQTPDGRWIVNGNWQAFVGGSKP